MIMERLKDSAMQLNLMADGIIRDDIYRAKVLDEIDHAVNIVRCTGATAKEMNDAPEDFLTEFCWDVGTKILHTTRHAAKAVSRVTETHYEMKKISGDLYDRETACFSGFIHDVACARFFMELIYNLAEAEWESYATTLDCKRLPRSARIVRRTEKLRNRTHDIRAFLAQIASQESVRRLNDPVLREITTVKRARVSRFANDIETA